MAYEDKDDTLFPTRTGQATGHANERTMLDELGGADNIRHRKRTGADGVVTHVKTRGGHPHFWNEPVESEEEETSPIYMDSGAVDLLSVSPYDPRAMLAAPLYYSSKQQIAFAEKKLLGKITPPSVTNNTPPANGTAGESFTPVEGSDLLGKKDCAAKAPPSLFTGKARMYAQAHLGGKLKDWKWSLDLPLGSAPQWLHDNGFVLDTNTGIYTDANNAHWLVQIRGDGVIVTKLVPSASVKELAPLLSTAATPLERDKVEAYILAYSTPSTTVMFGKAISGLPPPYMLGYGWKFNWGGNKADIIRHSEGLPQHTSTHYRLSINRNVGAGFAVEADRWTFTLSVVEGPVLWHNSKYSQVISAPEWITNTLYIFGTLYGGHTGNAPVYCFYREDDSLEVVRYYGSGGEEKIMYSRTASPSYYGPICDWTVNSSPIGMSATEFDTSNIVEERGGTIERRQRVYNPKTVGFSASGISSVSSAESYSYYTASLGSMAYDENWIGYVNLLNMPSLKQTTYTYNETGYGGAVYTTSEDSVPVFHGQIEQHSEEGAEMQNGGAYFDYYTGCGLQRVGLRYADGSHVETLYSLIIIPFHDAECAYVYGSKHTYRTETGETGNSGWATTDVRRKWHRYNSYDGGYTFVLTAEWDRFISTAPYGMAGTITENKTTFTDEVVRDEHVPFASSVITRSGTYPFTSPVSLGPFFSGVDFVAQTFYTHSAIHGPMYGFGAENPDGITHAFDSPPPFIGWA